MTDRELMQQALEALRSVQDRRPNDETNNAIAALKAALAEPEQQDSLITASCIACGNRMTGTPEHFVVATASDGVTAPEDCNPQQVEALHFYGGGDKTAPPFFAQPEQEPVACIGTNGELMWLRKPQAIYSKARPLYTTPLQRKPLTEEEIKAALISVDPETKRLPPGFREFARAIERAHGIGEKE